MTSQTSAVAGVDAAAHALRQLGADLPKVALVLGSGLGAFSDHLEDPRPLPFEGVPGLPASTVAGHAGRFVLGRCEGVPVVVMQGRVHLYEGHAPDVVVLGVRAMLRLGAERVVLTNAAGGINQAFVPGDLMLIDDHLNLTGQSCLVGQNDPSLGPRFPDMSHVYGDALRGLAEQTAAAHGDRLVHGVYAGLLGPSYETPAEIRMLRTLGADAVGMSTVLEAIAARHMGADCLGISCITNLAAGLSRTALSHAEVQETAARTQARFERLLRGVIERLG